MKRLPLTWNDSTLHLDIIQFGKFVEWSYSDLFLRAAVIWNKINERSLLDNYICSCSWREGEAKPVWRHKTIITTNHPTGSRLWLLSAERVMSVLIGSGPYLGSCWVRLKQWLHPQRPGREYLYWHWNIQIMFKLRGPWHVGQLGCNVQLMHWQGLIWLPGILMFVGLVNILSVSVIIIIIHIRHSSLINHNQMNYRRQQEAITGANINIPAFWLHNFCKISNLVVLDWDIFTFFFNHLVLLFSINVGLTSLCSIRL